VLIIATYVNGPRTAESPVEAALIAALVFLLSGLGLSHAWTVFGTGVGRFIGQGWRLRAFNLGMAALLAASAVWLVAAG
jgi:hypothetical protein